MGLGSQAPAAAQPEQVDDLTAVRTAFGAGLPSARSPRSRCWRRWGRSPPAFRVPPTSPVRCSWPRAWSSRSVRHVGVRLPAAQRSRRRLDRCRAGHRRAGRRHEPADAGHSARTVNVFVLRLGTSTSSPFPRRPDDGVVVEPEHDAFGNGTAVPGAPRGRSPHTVEHGRNWKGHGRFPGLGEHDRQHQPGSAGVRLRSGRGGRAGLMPSSRPPSARRRPGPATY